MQRECSEQVQAHMPDTLDALFSAEVVTPKVHARVLKLTRNIVKARKHMIRTSAHLTVEETRTALLRKLDAIDIRIGVPAHMHARLRSGRRVALSAAQPHLLNMLELKQRFIARRLLQLLHTDAQLARADEPLLMRTSAVNAYYNPHSNNICILAGIVTEPFFAMNYNDASEHGALGMIIAHEIGHATDANGILFDARGIIRPWIPEADMRRFDQANVCFASQYTARAHKSGMLESGARTVTEDVADNVGVQTMLISLKHELGLHSDEPLPQAEAYNVFLMFGQMWAVHSTAAQERSQIENDVHATAQFRVNKALANCPDFLRLYECHTSRVRCALVA
jgi:putative endopeptidase